MALGIQLHHTLSLTYDTKQTAVLSIMYLSAVGYVLVGAGIVIKDTEDIDHGDDDSGFLQAIDVLFAGGFITTLFWVRFYTSMDMNTTSYKSALYLHF